MAEFFNNIRTSIATLSVLERISIIGVFFILLCFSFTNILYAYYNSKKLVFKISPIIISAALLAIILFIALA